MSPRNLLLSLALVVPTSGSGASAAGADEPVLGEELVGRWAHYDVVAYEDEAFGTLIVSYGFNDLGIEGGRLIDRASFCWSEQVSDQPFESSLSDAATQAIRPPATPLTVEEVDGVLRISRPPTPTPIGIRLDDPATEPLPSDPEDPRVVDDDGDGEPGVTVSIDIGAGIVGEIYIARREIFEYEATQVEPDLLTGTVTDTSEQLVIGANNPLFLASEADWVQHPDPEKSFIVLRRVADDWDCDRLRSERDELFPPNPEVDW
ncbi:MAG: hypothetical protein AB1Z67_02150 [Candidatus Limnocylindrales bacterium]